MLNLITDTEQKRLKHEYFLRLASMVLVMLFVVISVGAMLLVPSFITLKIEGSALESNLVALEASIAKQGGDDARTFLEETRQRATLIATHADRPSIRDLFLSIIDARASGIQIHSFFFDEGKGETATILLRGNAETRTALVAFRDMLETNDQFESVSLPLRDLASNRDISFAVTIEMKK